MKRIFCDRCDYDVTETYRHYKARVVLLKPTGKGMGVDKAQDLCADCARELELFARDKKPRDVAA